MFTSSVLYANRLNSGLPTSLIKAYLYIFLLCRVCLRISVKCLCRRTGVGRAKIASPRPPTDRILSSTIHSSTGRYLTPNKSVAEIHKQPHNSVEIIFSLDMLQVHRSRVKNRFPMTRPSLGASLNIQCFWLSEFVLKLTRGELLNYFH